MPLILWKTWVFFWLWVTDISVTSHGCGGYFLELFSNLNNSYAESQHTLDKKNNLKIMFPNIWCSSFFFFFFFVDPAFNCWIFSCFNNKVDFKLTYYTLWQTLIFVSNNKYPLSFGYLTSDWCLLTNLQIFLQLMSSHKSCKGLFHLMKSRWLICLCNN